MSTATDRIAPPPAGRPRALLAGALRELRPALPFLPALAFLGLVYAFPLGKMFLRSVHREGNLTLANYEKFFETDVYLRVLGQTFLVSLIVTLACLVLGYIVAYILAHVSRRSRNLLLVLVVAPWLTSQLARTFSWQIILGRSGPVNDTLMALGIVSEPIKFVGTTSAVYISMIHVQLPLAVLPIYSVMQGLDRRLPQVAESLGASPLRAFRDVYLPLTLPGISGAALLLFISSLGMFIFPALLGGERDLFMSNLIDQQINALLDWGVASAMSVVLLGAALVCFAIYSRFLGLERLQLGGHR